MHSVEARGTLFINPGDKVYAGMIIGENSREEDIDVNVCKKKHLTNFRAAGSEEAIRLTPPTVLTLEQAMVYIEEDELVEVTPESIRLRKKILDRNQRRRIDKYAIRALPAPLSAMLYSSSLEPSFTSLRHCHQDDAQLVQCQHGDCHQHLGNHIRGRDNGGHDQDQDQA